jgi:hypothetical protein
MFEDRSSRAALGESQVVLPHGSRSYAMIEEGWRASHDVAGAILREFVVSPTEPLHINLERLVELLSEAQRDTSLFGAWIFREGARTLASIPHDASFIDNNDFSHAAKYLFCGACFKPPLRSVLDDVGSLPDATALVNRAVQFCESSRSLGTTPLIIRGIVVTNMRRWFESGRLDEFYYKPGSLISSEFLNLVRMQSGDEVLRSFGSQSPRVTAPHRLNLGFCEATSPTEFLLWVFEHKLTLPLPELHSRLHALLVDHLGEDATRYPFLNRTETRSDSIPQSVDTVEFSPGYYFDVFGTLIAHDGAPNTRLIQLMMDLRAKGNSPQVFLVSDSQPEEVAKALSFIPDHPPLLYKEDLRLRELEFLIDNSAPSGQGLHARRHLLPDQAVETLRAALPS